jgi:hypothetical protein
MSEVAEEANVSQGRFEMVRRRPRGVVCEIIAGLSGYLERSGKGFVGREAAPLVFPIVLNLGHPFRISLSPGADAPHTPSSFVAGLHPGAVEIVCDGFAECVQIDLTLLGACVLGGVIKVLTSDVVELGDALGPSWLDLRDRLADLRNWDHRFR